MSGMSFWSESLMAALNFAYGRIRLILLEFWRLSDETGLLD
jgi:hypothetical protein